jgi:hypothetical protein
MQNFNEELKTNLKLRAYKFGLAVELANMLASGVKKLKSKL